MTPQADSGWPGGWFLAKKWGPRSRACHLSTLLFCCLDCSSRVKGIIDDEFKTELIEFDS